MPGVGRGRAVVAHVPHIVTVRVHLAGIGHAERAGRIIRTRELLGELRHDKAGLFGVVFLVLLVLSGIPTLAAPLMLGGVTLRDVLLVALLLAVTAVYLGLIGLEFERLAEVGLGLIPASFAFMGDPAREEKRPVRGLGVVDQRDRAIIGLAGLVVAFEPAEEIAEADMHRRQMPVALAELGQHLDRRVFAARCAQRFFQRLFGQIFSG